MHSRILLFVCLVTATEAEAVQFGLYTSADCSSCNLTIALGETKTLYLNATHLDPQSSSNLQVHGIPETWVAVATPDPIVESGGDPTAGATWVLVGNVDPAECVTVYTIELTATTVESDVLLTVSGPSGPTACIPYLPECFMCDPLCVAGGTMTVNAQGECQIVGIEAQTWGAVKQLYRP